jgi:hypothetical protein
MRMGNKFLSNKYSPLFPGNNLDFCNFELKHNLID